jgi:hypothetical protein
MQDLKTSLKNILFERGGRSLNLHLRHNSSDISEKIPFFNSLNESVYRFIFNISDTNCECGNPRVFKGFTKGYTQFCSNRKCIFMLKEKVKNMRKTFNEKYNGHPMKTEKVKETLKQKIREKYGTDNITGFRVSNGSFVSPFKNKEVQLKIKKTFDQKYGGHPMRCDESFEKNLKSRVKFKEYVLPSGKTVKLQGYEDKGLNFLLSKHDETDIISSVKDIREKIGTIEYYLDNRIRKYYPDFYVVSTNTIYEVKSTWTYKSNREKNEAKKYRCLELGFNFEFLLF